MTVDTKRLHRLDLSMSKDSRIAGTLLPADRNPQEITTINDLENESGHEWSLPKVSGVTRDDN